MRPLNVKLESLTFATQRGVILNSLFINPFLSIINFKLKFLLRQSFLIIDLQTVVRMQRDPLNTSFK